MPLVRTTVYRVTLAQRLSQSLKDPVALEHWRSSLVPASAVIPAPAVYFLVVAAKVPDVRLSLGQRPSAPLCRSPVRWRCRQPGRCYGLVECYPSLFKPLCPTPPLHLIVWIPRGASHPALAEAARTELKPALSKQAFASKDLARHSAGWTGPFLAPVSHELGQHQGPRAVGKQVLTGASRAPGMLIELCCER